MSEVPLLSCHGARPRKGEALRALHSMPVSLRFQVVGPICSMGRREVAARGQGTRGPSWGHHSVILGAIVSFVEPFGGRLSQKLTRSLKN